jgi:glycosyltransferase involved in cell wall biosynthesis
VTPQIGHVGYVGRLAPSKRVDHIIRAFGIVHREFPEAVLSVVGSGSEREIDRLVALTNDLGLADAVHFHGRVTAEKRDEIVQSLDVLAMASLREGWGLVVSEAARFGVPSVVYPAAGLVDSVKNGESGIVCGTSTPEALADGLLRIIRDREMRARLASNAKQYLLQFDEQRFVGRFEQILLHSANSYADAASSSGRF